MAYPFHFLNQNTFRLLVVTWSTDQRSPKALSGLSRPEHCDPRLPGAFINFFINSTDIYLVPSIMPGTVLNAWNAAVNTAYILVEGDRQ